MAFSIHYYIYVMTNVTESASDELLSTVAMLPDQVLLEQTRMLARHEHALQLSVLDHLREIETRRLYLRRGFSSLFDYTVRELRYTEAAAWRRIKAMRLCRETRGVRERLQDGSLNLSNAALLQNSFERWDRGGGGPGAAAPVGRGRGAAGSAAAGPGAAGSAGGGQGVAGSAGAGQGAAGSEAAGASAAAGGGSAAAPGEAAGAPVPVLDAHARQELVERAMGKSTRQVQQMLAEVDPEAAAPAERLRPLGDGRWELKAVVDADCQRGLQKLRELLSHVDPHLSVGQLVGRLVREGVERYDPSRPPRRKRRKSDPASDGCSAETAGPETTDRVAAAAENPRRAGKSAVATTSPSAPKRSAKPTAVSAPPGVLPAGGGSGEAAPKRGLGPTPGSPASAPKLVAPRSERARGAGDAAATEPTSAPKAGMAAGSRSIPEQSSHGVGSAELTSAPKLGVAGGAGSVAPTAATKSGKSSGRSIPAAVRREVWRRDSGCCSYFDRHTGRRCGSRFFLELDHIVPVARGGGAEPANLRL